MGLWMKAGLDKLELQSCDFDFECSETFCLLKFTKRYLDGAIVWKQNISLVNTGEIMFENHLSYNEDLPSLPRVGVNFSLVPGYESLEWLGRGPHENYSDRKAGAAIGLYASTVDEQYVPYILPQAHGNHTDVSWFSLSNGPRKLEFRASKTFDFSVSHFTQDDLFRSYHTHELKKHKKATTWVQIDHLQRGVGSGSCGPQTREDYCIKPGKYSFSFSLRVL